MFFYLLLFLLAILISISLAGTSLIIWVPARKNDLGRILSLADLKPGEIFYDLGCGNGRVTDYIARNSQAKVVGLELAWPLYLVCIVRKILRPAKNLSYACRNLFKADLSGVDVVYVFGIPDKLKSRLKPKLEKELKPGARVISYAFEISDWQPKLVDKPSKDAMPIYLYLI